MSADEQVLCVPSDYVNDVLPLMFYTPEYKLSMFLANQTYIPRSRCETDERFRQLIPYVVIRCNGLILAYQRKGTEDRLNGLWSIGVGGHINNTDEGWLGGVAREIREETGFADPIGLTGTAALMSNWSQLSGPLGFLRDDSTAVNRVHLGVLYTLDVPDVNAVHMTECADYVWEAANCLDVRNLETWSRMALGMLKGGA